MPYGSKKPSGERSTQSNNLGRASGVSGASFGNGSPLKSQPSATFDEAASPGAGSAPAARRESTSALDAATPVLNRFSKINQNDLNGLTGGKAGDFGRAQGELDFVPPYGNDSSIAVFFFRFLSDVLQDNARRVGDVKDEKSGRVISKGNLDRPIVISKRTEGYKKDQKAKGVSHSFFKTLDFQDPEIVLKLLLQVMKSPKLVEYLERLQTHEIQIEELNAQRDVLRREIDAERAQHSDYVSSKDTIARLRAELIEKGKEIEGRDSEISQLKTDLGSKNAELIEALRKLKESEEDNAKQKKEIASLKEALAKQDRDVKAERDKVAEDRRKEIERLNEAHKEDHEKAIRLLKDSNQDAMGRLTEAYEARLREVGGAASGRQADASRKAEEMGEMKARIADLEAKLKQSQSDLGQSQQKLQEVEDARVVREQTIVGFLNKEAEAAEQFKAAKAQLQAAEGGVGSPAKSAAASPAVTRKASGGVESGDLLIGRDTQRLEQLLEKMERLREKVLELEMANIGLQKDAALSGDDLAGKNAQLAKQLQDVQGELGRMRQQLQLKAQEFDSLQREKGAMVDAQKQKDLEAEQQKQTDIKAQLRRENLLDLQLNQLVDQSQVDPTDQNKNPFNFLALEKAAEDEGLVEIKERTNRNVAKLAAEGARLKAELERLQKAVNDLQGRNGQRQREYEEARIARENELHAKEVEELQLLAGAKKADGSKGLLFPAVETDEGVFAAKDLAAMAKRNDQDLTTITERTRQLVGEYNRVLGEFSKMNDAKRALDGEHASLKDAAAQLQGKYQRQGEKLETAKQGEKKAKEDLSALNAEVAELKKTNTALQSAANDLTEKLRVAEDKIKKEGERMAAEADKLKRELKEARRQAASAAGGASQADLEEAARQKDEALRHIEGLQADNQSLFERNNFLQSQLNELLRNRGISEEAHLKAISIITDSHNKLIESRPQVVKSTHTHTRTVERGVAGGDLHHLDRRERRIMPVLADVAAGVGSRVDGRRTEVAAVGGDVAPVDRAVGGKRGGFKSINYEEVFREAAKRDFAMQSKVEATGEEDLSDKESAFFRALIVGAAVSDKKMQKDFEIQEIVAENGVLQTAQRVAVDNFKQVLVEWYGLREKEGSSLVGNVFRRDPNALKWAKDKLESGKVPPSVRYEEPSTEPARVVIERLESYQQGRAQGPR